MSLSAGATGGSAGSLVPGCLWGKSDVEGAGYPLIAHLVDTKAIAGVLFDEFLSPMQRRFLCRAFGSEAAARWFVKQAAGLHDLGKAVPHFQRQVPELAPDVTGYVSPIHHTVAGATHVLSSSQVAVSALGWEQALAQVLLGHHGDYRGRNLKDAPLLDGALAGRVLELQRGRLGDAAWDVARETLRHAVWDTPPSGFAGTSTAAAAVHVVTGVVVAADWIASSSMFLRQRRSAVPPQVTGDVSRWVPGAETAARQVASVLVPRYGLRSRVMEPFPSGFEDEFGFAPRGVQQPLSQGLLDGVDFSHGGLVLVTAPTGEGKTEAALWTGQHLASATGATGVTVALPTMATTDAMFTRVKSHLGKQDVPVALLHGYAALNPEAHGRVGSEDHGAVAKWLQGSKKGLLATSVVCTVDQVLVAALRAKHGMLRWTGLSNKVLIVDEVHAYDAYMQGLLQRALTWLGSLGVPVVLLSATLNTRLGQSLVRAYAQGCDATAPADVPRATADQLSLQVQYPGVVTYSAATGEAVSTFVPTEREWDVRLKRHVMPGARTGKAQGPDPQFAATAVELLSPVLSGGEPGVAAVVMNTVRAAQEAYDAICADADPDVEVLLLHARMPMRERRRRATELLARLGPNAAAGRPARMVVVGTQVLEQSLDIDVDVMVTQLAPLAMLMQRAGRVWRHPREDRPAWVGPTAPVHVLVPATSDSGAPARWDSLPYEWDLLRVSEQALAGWETEQGTVRVPGDLQTLMDRVYDAWDGDEAVAAEMTRAQAAQAAKQTGERQIAEMVAIPPVRGLRLGDMSPLTSADDPEAQLQTRLGAERSLVVPFVEDEHGRRSLLATNPYGPGEDLSWPTAPLSDEDRERLLDHAIPVSQPGLIAALGPCPDWAGDAVTSDLLIMPVSSPDHTFTYRPGGGADNRSRASVDSRRGLML